MGLIEGSKTNLPPRNLKRGGKYYTGKAAVIDSVSQTFPGYFDQIHECLHKTIATSPGYKLGNTADALALCCEMFRDTHKRGGRVFFVGNGGSAAIASHMAVDYTKNGGVRALALNDAATLTCFGNDYGYDFVFAKQLEYQARDVDAVVIVSSSGKSPNVLHAADEARVIGVNFTLTLTGMNPNNVLRQKGNVNLYVPCSDYGLVECTHLALLHSMVGR